MLDIILKSDFEIDFIDGFGSDEFICKAARVSTLGSESIDSEESFGLINFLMKNRHGSPFEHGGMTFRIKAPIFVWREFMRHRIGFSYNEQSGRYMELSPEFYIPNDIRPLVQEGRPGSYIFVPGTPEQYDELINDLGYSYHVSWERYQRQLQKGIAKEVARFCLPVATYSSAYVTCNPRSMMSFLSLRTKDKESMFPSYPQEEIHRVAKIMEKAFALRFPLTHEAFHENGRVSP